MNAYLSEKLKMNLPNGIQLVTFGPLRLRVLSMEPFHKTELACGKVHRVFQSLGINLTKQEVAVSVFSRLGVVTAQIHGSALGQIHSMPQSAPVRSTRGDSETMSEDAFNFIQRRAVPSPARRDVRSVALSRGLDVRSLKRVFHGCDTRDDKVLLR